MSDTSPPLSRDAALKLAAALMEYANSLPDAPQLAGHSWGGHTDWIPYCGEGCPVDNGVVVNVVCRRDLACDEWVDLPMPGEDWDWSIDGDPGDIIAYRTVEG